MKRVSVKCVVLCVVLSIGSMASAQDWNGGAGVDLPFWDVAANWDTGTAPTGGTIDIGPAINVPDGVEPWACVIDEETEKNLGAPIDLSRFRVGADDGPGILTMTGGLLTTTYFRVGKSAGDVGTINLSGGTMSTKTSPGRDVQIGVDGIGTLNMTGGSVITYNSFRLGNSSNAASFGYLNMDGGSITVDDNFTPESNGHLRMAGGQIICGGQVQVASCQYDLYGGTITAGSLSVAEGMNMDVSGGKVVLGSNADLDTYINDGRLTAWGGLGMINVVEVNEVIDGNNVVTYELTGTADANIMAKAFKPSPASGAVMADEELTLKWIAGKGMKAQNVYFGQDPNALAMLPNDPNDPNEGIIQGVLSVEFSYDVNNLVLGETYYWRVDEVNESDVVTTGDVWSIINMPLELANVVSPLDGATGVDTVDLTLEWESGLGAVSADVYFGSDAENLALVADDTTETTYAVTQSLILGMTYYWRVDSFDGNDVYPGLTWSFIVTSPAGSTTFTDGDPANSLWSSPDNWSDGLPGAGSTANLRNTAGAIVVVDANTTAYCSGLQMGWSDGDVGDLDIYGSLT